MERVPSPHKDTNYLVRFAAPEFTSICPVTGQPDFAHLVIDYVPQDWIVESKSLKLYLGSFRNHGAFHEDCTVRVGRDIVSAFKTVTDDIGAHKGIVVTTMGFQSGAIDAAGSLYGTLVVQ